MRGLLWRVLIAVICVALAVALIPPVTRLIGLAMSADFYAVVKLCIAGLAVLYILAGPEPRGPAV